MLPVFGRTTDAVDSSQRVVCPYRVLELFLVLPTTCRMRAWASAAKKLERCALPPPLSSAPSSSSSSGSGGEAPPPRSRRAAE